MSSDLTQTGFGNLALQDIHHSTVNIEQVTQLIDKSVDYRVLEDRLRELEEVFEYAPEEKKLGISKKINDQKELINQFKNSVLQLAEQFNRSKINTRRLQQAREFFEKGEFAEARALLNDDEERIRSEEEFLWTKRESYQQQIEAKLKEKAEERLIQALLNQSDYANPVWFADTCRNFERSIKSYPNKSNIFQYAFFLKKHNEFTKAEKYYSQYLKDFAHQLSPEEKAMILNNLANSHREQHDYEKALKEFEEALRIYRALTETNPGLYLHYAATALNNLALLHSDQNNYEAAAKEFEEALQIRCSLAEVNPDTYLPFVATTLNGLANLHSAGKNYEEASREYKEALRIYQTLAEVKPNTFLSDVAMTLNNLAVLHQDQQNYEEALKEYEETLRIYRALAEANPNAYLSDVAMTLNNFASLQATKGELEDALRKFEESTEIYRQLAAANFQAYFPYLAGNFTNLALFYYREIQHREKSIAYAIEAMTILLPNIEKTPFMRQDFTRVLIILRKWNLSNEEIGRLIDEKIKETRENRA